MTIPHEIHLLTSDAELFKRKYGHPRLTQPLVGDDSVTYVLKSVADGNLYVSGCWRCAKCGFRLIQRTLNATDGTVTDRNEPGEECPNCNKPLWRVTWQNEAEECYKITEQWMNRKHSVDEQLAIAKETLKRIHLMCRDPGEHSDKAVNGWVEVESRNALLVIEELGP